MDSLCGRGTAIHHLAHEVGADRRSGGCDLGCELEGPSKHCFGDWSGLCEEVAKMRGRGRKNGAGCGEVAWVVLRAGKGGQEEVGDLQSFGEAD